MVPPIRTPCGTQINHYILLEDAPNKTIRVRVRCKCDREYLRTVTHIERNPQCASCAAVMRNTTHGMTNTPTHRIWMGIHSRCNNPKVQSYKYYGGRGVTVCERWSGKDGFIHFLEDMGERPGPDYEIDKDKKGGLGCKIYSPDTCMWILYDENRRLSIQSRGLYNNTIT